MVPSSVAKMKRLESFVVPSLTLKSSALPLKTTPVGAPPLVALGAGILTTRDWGAPVPAYRVETWPLLSATHQGVLGPCTMPQGFFKLVSGNFAPPRSDTRLV